MELFIQVLDCGNTDYTVNTLTMSFGTEFSYSNNVRPMFQCFSKEWIGHSKNYQGTAVMKTVSNLDIHDNHTTQQVVLILSAHEATDRDVTHMN